MCRHTMKVVAFDAGQWDNEPRALRWQDGGPRAMGQMEWCAKRGQNKEMTMGKMWCTH